MLCRFALLIICLLFFIFSGVACISVSVLNWRSGYIYIPCGKRVCVYAGEIDLFEYLTEVSLCPDELHLGNY